MASVTFSCVFVMVTIQLFFTLIIYFLIPFPASAEFAGKNGILVNTTEGFVFGRKAYSAGFNKPYTQYLGLRYAEPPLRFAPPVLYKPNRTDALLDRSKEPEPCLQPLIYESGFIGGEDCLKLNVYSPDECAVEGRKKCPVMVWLHPGGFFALDANPGTFGPAFFMDKAVVVVGINYRLGVLGFLSFDTDDAPGNLGLRDQRTALEWIQREISSFGGDPESVTLFGSGSGGLSAFLQLSSMTERKLFHSIISHSGSPIRNPSFNHEGRSRSFHARKLAQRVGCPDLECLRTKKTALELVEAAPEVKSAKSSDFPLFSIDPIDPNPFLPSIDVNVTNPFFTKALPPTTGKSAVSVLMGMNEADGIVQMAPFAAKPSLFAGFASHVKKLLGLNGDCPEGDQSLLDLVKLKYRLDFAGHSGHRMSVVRGGQMFNDLFYKGQIWAQDGVWGLSQPEPEFPFD